MGILTKLLDPGPTSVRSNNFIDKLDQLDFFGTPSKSGKRVTVDTALQVATVFACVMVIANGIATPPLHVWRSRGDGQRDLARGTRQYRILHARPNVFQTSFQFRQQMTMHAALVGDAVAMKTRVRGDVRELIPLMPGRYSIRQDESFRMFYDVSDANGVPIGTLEAKDVVHLRGPSWSGVGGIDVVKLARDALGLSIALEESASKLHANGGRPGGILTTDESLGKEAVEQIRAAWQQGFGGSNQHGTAVMDNGMKYLPLAMSGVDSQHREQRQFQIEEVCRFFGVFPQMVMNTDKASTYASAEAFFAAHVRHTLGPWFALWNGTLDEFFLDGAGPLYTEFDTRQMTMASTADREKFYRTVAEVGIYTRNELREQEGLPPLPGLDEPLTPMNMNGSGSNDDATDDR
jgi:HK97 family phage portal protein